MVDSTNRTSRVALRTTVLGFAGALATLAVFTVVVETDAIVATLAGADRMILGGAFVAAVGVLLIWGLGLNIVFSALGQSVSAWQSISLFIATVFLNNVTPFGQVGGDPFSGLVAAWVADTTYEQGLAAIVSLNTLNMVVSVWLGVVCLGYIVTEIAADGWLGLAAIGTLVLLTFGWRYRTRLTAVTVAMLVPPARVVGHLVPRLSKPDRAAVAGHVERFVESLERLTGDPRRMVVVVACSLLGQLCVGTCLWLSLFALGAVVPVLVVLVVIPIARFAAIAPTPGGLAAVEIALVGLLVATTGVTVVVASAAVLVYRAVTFWLPAVVGGGVTAVIVAYRR